jgi:predicted MFS family arabinose efflux permease
VSGRPHPTVVAVSAATAFSLLGDQMLYAVLPAYFEQLGLTAIEVGTLLSANRWIRLVTNQIAHVASPRLPPRLLLAGAFALGTLTTLGYAATASFGVLVFARLAWGLAWSFIRHVGVLEVIAHAPADAGGRAIGFYNGIARIGSVAGLLGGAALVDAFGYVAAVFMLAAASLVSIGLVMRDRSLVSLPPRTRTDAPRSRLDRRGIVELSLGFSIGIVGPGFVTSTLGVVLQPYIENGPGPLLPGITAATITGALLALRFAIESAAAPALGAVSDRWGIRRTAMRFFLLGGVALLAACLQQDSLPLLTLFMLAFFASSTALHSGVSATVSAHGSAAYARYVTAGDIGSATGPLLGWIAVDLFGYAAIGLLLGAGVYLAAALVSRTYLR